MSKSVKCILFPLLFVAAKLCSNEEHIVLCGGVWKCGSYSSVIEKENVKLTGQ